jgi:type VI secretion system protein
MSERTLLERLRDPDSAGNLSVTLNVGAATRSVLSHLGRMFNSRQGHSQTVPDYGLPDLTDFMRSFPASARDMEKAIQQCIERFEPRLASVRVRFDRSERETLKLTFNVRAKLVIDDEMKPISFSADLDADGRLRVKQ